MPRGIPKSGINKGWFKKGSKINKGRKFSKKHREKLREAKLRNPVRYWLGKRRPDVAGENCNTWKGGITPENSKIRNSIEARIWRGAVFARDGWTCQKCGIKSGQGKAVYLTPHHIKNFAQYPELRFAIDNGITLCRECHKNFHRKYGVKNNDKQQIEEFLRDNGALLIYQKVGEGKKN